MYCFLILDPIDSYFPTGRDDTTLIARPLSHFSVLIGELLLVLCNGSKIVFSPKSFQRLNI